MDPSPQSATESAAAEPWRRYFLHGGAEVCWRDRGEVIHRRPARPHEPPGHQPCAYRHDADRLVEITEQEARDLLHPPRT